MNIKTILIVGNDRTSRQILKDEIHAMGFETMEAADGEEAWKIIQASFIECVITDWMPPKMDGIGLCTRIRNKIDDRYVYVIMLIPKDSQVGLARISESETDDYITKPLNLDELRIRLKTGVRMLQLQHQSGELNRRLLKTSTQMELQNQELKSTVQKLQQTQAQMIQSEKMASIGQLAAGIAHEINNPTGYVSSNLKSLSDYHEDMQSLIRKYQFLLAQLDKEGSHSAEINQVCKEVRALEQEIDIEFLLLDTVDLIKDCREGTQRIKKIVLDLKDFAHPGEDQITSTDINAGLESTLNVVNNEIKYKAKVIKEFGTIPTVLGHPQQLNQVFMNILVNAAQAIEGKGEIWIKTLAADGHVEIHIRDTGCGIPKENINRIFDPFFTTKEVGKGTGLGMNIAYNIILKHNGSIEVCSRVGEGTTFIVKLPAEAGNHF
jgi:two-component system NtrC family sensor kinase